MNYNYSHIVHHCYLGVICLDRLLRWNMINKQKIILKSAKWHPKRRTTHRPEWNSLETTNYNTCCLFLPCTGFLWRDFCTVPIITLTNLSPGGHLCPVHKKKKKQWLRRAEDLLRDWTLSGGWNMVKRQNPGLQNGTLEDLRSRKQFYINDSRSPS